MTAERKQEVLERFDRRRVEIFGSLAFRSEEVLTDDSIERFLQEMDSTVDLLPAMPEMVS